MLTEKDVLDVLDNSVDGGYYNSFIDLGHVYSYLIDSRLNIFRSNDGRWAIAGERLGFNPRAGGILLDIYFFGNCLVNLEHYNGQDTNWYSVTPIDWESFQETIDSEVLKPAAEYWLVRGEKLPLSHDKQDYFDAGITLKEYVPNEISTEEVGRLMVTKYKHFFRATDEELCKSIPSDLEKVLVLDEWYHRDYERLYEQHISDYHINLTYEVSKQRFSGDNFTDYESFISQYKQDEQKRYEDSLRRWQHCLPSSYETWQQIAKVIVSGNPMHYNPTLKSNSHWKFWPDSGSL